MSVPFRGLHIREDPESRYDAIVVGAGVGGLICANLLAAAGMKTLLVEQHYVVGGYCSTFTRKNFKFDAASHFYPLLGNRDSITGRLLDRLRVETGWVKMDPVDHFHFPDGSNYSVPADFDSYFNDLLQMFPQEREALGAFFEEVKALNLMGLLAYFRGNDVERLQRHEGCSLGEALDRHFEDEKLKLLLTADCPHWGSPPKRISYVFDSMLRLSYFLGNYYPIGGSQRFSDDLAYAFERAGGTAVLRAKAKRILIENDKVAGLELELGSPAKRRTVRVESPIVVSNADMLQTTECLLGEELVGREYINNLRGIRRSFPCYLMHIGLKDTEPEELEEHQGYHWAGWDPNEVGTSALRFKFFVPTMFDRSVAPEGSQIVIVQKVIDCDFEGIENWPAHKEEIDDFVLGYLKEMVPRFSERTVVRLSASAMTSYRYTLNQAGAMLGWEMAPDQLGDRRPGAEGPVEGLYFCGHWTRPGGGITPVIVSAMQAAGKVTGEHYF